MILTITLNPAVDISYRLENLTIDGVNRCSNIIKTAGGKGLNVTRVIAQLKEKVCATGLLGGANGQFIVDKLTENNIYNDFLTIKGETRNCIAVLHSGNQTEILESGPDIHENEKNEFLRKYEKLLDNTDVVVASGSIPKGLGKDFYKELIRICNRKNKKFLLDTSGEALKSALEARPYLIKPNKDEISQLLNKKVDTEESVINALIELSKYNISNIVVSLGSEGALALTEGKMYKIKPPKVNAVNPVGSGDSTVAGFAIGIKKGFGSEKMLKFGCVLGTLNALEKETGRVNPDLIDEFMDKTNITIIKEI